MLGRYGTQHHLLCEDIGYKTQQHCLSQSELLHFPVCHHTFIAEQQPYFQCVCFILAKSLYFSVVVIV